MDTSWRRQRRRLALRVTDLRLTHRVWEVKREDAVGAIRAMLDQAPEPVLADDPAYAGALVGGITAPGR